MMKDVTILTFDEMEKIRQDLNNMIDNAREGFYGTQDASVVCKWLVEDLEKFRSQFD